MIKHIVLWKFKSELTEIEKSFAKDKIKKELESLTNVIDGIVDMKVETNMLSMSTCDAMLESTFESEEALKMYKEHPEHVKVSTFVKTVLESRSCADYII